MRPRSIYVLFLAGPVVWSLHFGLVYLGVEATCASGGSDLRVLGLPLLSFATVAATIVAVAVAVLFAAKAHRRRRENDSDDSLASASFLLGLLFAVAIAFVGLPALFLMPC